MGSYIVHFILVISERQFYPNTFPSLNAEYTPSSLGGLVL